MKTITLENYPSIIDQIGISNLNDAQKEAHDLIKEGSENFKNMKQMKELMDDPDIRETVEMYFDQIATKSAKTYPVEDARRAEQIQTAKWEAEAEERRAKAKPATTKKIVTRAASKKKVSAKTPKKKPVAAKKPTTKKAVTPVTSKKKVAATKKKTGSTTAKKKVVTSKKVVKPPVVVKKYSKELQLLKSVSLLHGKEKSKRSIEMLNNRIANAMKDGHVTDHKTVIDESRKRLAEFLGKMGNSESAKVDIDPEFLKKIKGHISGATERMTVSYLAGVTKKKSPKIKMPMLAGWVTADQANTVQAPEVFKLKGVFGEFLGELQKYMLAIKLEGESHSGKTQVAYQIADAFIDLGLTVGACDFEQGGLESKDTRATIERNVKKANLPYLAVNGKVPEGDRLSKIKEFANKFDVILLDSWQSLKQVTSQRFNELREEFPYTAFIVVFQKNSAGTTKGGASSQFDAPVAIDCFKVDEGFPKYNYAKLTKNRGNQITGKYYNIVSKKLYDTPLLPEPKKETELTEE